MNTETRVMIENLNNRIDSLVGPDETKRPQITDGIFRGEIIPVRRERLEKLLVLAEAKRK